MKAWDASGRATPPAAMRDDEGCAELSTLPMVIRIPNTCKTMTDVEAFLAERLGVEVRVTIEDADWGVGDVWAVDGMDLDFLGRLDDDAFLPDPSGIV